MDILLTAVLLGLLGSIGWLERARFWPALGGVSSADGLPTRGYYWLLARQAGVAPDETRMVFHASRIITAALVPMLLMEVAGPTWWLLLLCPFGALLPDLALALVRRQRQRAIRQILSFFLDLLLSLLQAGLTLEDAFRRAAELGLPPGHPLRDETLRVVGELGLGQERGVAFSTLGERTGVDELRSLSDAMTIGLSRGISLDQVIKAQADLARAKRREEGIKRLDRANAELLLPLVLSSFPMFVALVLVPLGVQLSEGLEALGRVLR